MPDVIERLNAALDGRYRIERELGQGGMATVYLAMDVKHNRHVALKVLKPELAAVVGAERFLAEIETTAKLQHPHILPLFDSGEADTFLFYVMPYIEGETLRDRIDREKQLPVDEALGIATAVAHALQTAHDHGVIHRDIKPGNILLSRGEPLVADFGIALAVGAAGGSRLTETGLSVGTPYYMSPEQATGDQVVGPASDTYALACVLYEMLTGDPPYPGSTAQAVLGKIIQGLPVSATAVRRSIPLNVDAAIRKALEKLPADRFTNAQAFAKALADRTFRYGQDAAAVADSGARRWRGLAIAASVVAVASLAFTGWSLSRSTDGPGPLTRVRIEPLAPDLPRAVGAFTALAPDGSSMVYALPNAAGVRLWLKTFASAEATPLTGTDGAQNVVYSPDGQSIAFAAGSELKRRPIGDGSTVTLAEGLAPTGPASMSAVAWLDDGTILFEAPGPTLMRIPEAGGRADTVQVFSALGYTNLAWAGALPGSRGALVAICPAACGAGISLGVIDFATDTTRVLLEGVVRGWYTPTGHLMYARTDGAVFAAPFDLGDLALTGPGIPLFAGVQVNVSTPELAVAWDGTVLYATGQASAGGRELVWADREGNAELVDPSLSGPTYVSAVLSPEHDRAAIVLVDPDAEGGGVEQIWVKELPDGPMTRLTTAPGSARRPLWSRDGRRISFIADNYPDRSASHARAILADGSSQGVSEVLLEREGRVVSIDFSPDERGVAFTFVPEGSLPDLGFADLAADTVNEALLASSFIEALPTFSPDGRWLAYVSDTSGDSEVFVRPFPEGTSRVQVSTNGGLSPVWAHNGRELFYVDDDGWLSVAEYRADPTFTVASRQRLFSLADYFGDGNWRVLDLAADDERILLVRATDTGAEEEQEEAVILVRNYFKELRERVGG